jgi:predicted HD phosphohydrolase
MTAQEVAKFKTERYGSDAVLIRQCDDQGKVAGLKTPGLADYRSMIEALTLG